MSLVISIGSSGSTSSPTVTLDEVKLRLNKTLTVDDDEILDIIGKAEAEYVEWVGPILGPVVDTFNGGGTSRVLRSPRALALTAASYRDGSTLNLSDLYLDPVTAIVYWLDSTSGRFTTGVQNVTLTYTLQPLPENHRETIVADICGYFATTQRGGTAAAFPGADVYEQAAGVTPLVLFPRIRDLAKNAPKVA